MKKIVAIGGGQIGRPGFPVETTKNVMYFSFYTKRIPGSYAKALIFRLCERNEAIQ